MRTRSLTSTLLVAAILSSSAANAQENVPSAADALALVTAGRADEAAAAWKKRADADESDGQAAFYYAYSLHLTGDLDAAHEADLVAARFPEFTARALYNHACVHALRDQKDAAFTALGEAVEAGFNSVEQLETDSDMDNLRGDGRFAALVLSLSGTRPSNIALLPPARRFDFYVGSWNMKNGDRIERRLEVTSAYDGYGLEVESTDLPTGTANAMSLFLYDEDDGVWRQIWMSKTGMHVILEGGLEGDAMILRQVSIDGKAATEARAVFTDITDSGFKYEWQTTSDEGKTWETTATRVFERTR